MPLSYGGTLFSYRYRPSVTAKKTCTLECFLLLPLFSPSHPTYTESKEALLNPLTSFEARYWRDDFHTCSKSIGNGWDIKEYDAQCERQWQNQNGFSGHGCCGFLRVCHALAWCVHLKARQAKRHVSKKGTVTVRQMEDCTHQGDQAILQPTKRFSSLSFSLLIYTSLYLSVRFYRLFLLILFTRNRIQLSCFKL